MNDKHLIDCIEPEFKTVGMESGGTTAQFLIRSTSIISATEDLV
jgi:hypothetical protein